MECNCRVPGVASSISHWLGHILNILLLFLVLEDQARGMDMLGKCWTTKLKKLFKWIEVIAKGSLQCLRRKTVEEQHTSWVGMGYTCLPPDSINTEAEFSLKTKT